jgi:hypothetical protein
LQDSVLCSIVASCTSLCSCCASCSRRLLSPGGSVLHLCWLTVNSGAAQVPSRPSASAVRCGGGPGREILAVRTLPRACYCRPALPCPKLWSCRSFALCTLPAMPRDTTAAKGAIHRLRQAMCNRQRVPCDIQRATCGGQYTTCGGHLCTPFAVRSCRTTERNTTSRCRSMRRTSGRPVRTGYCRQTSRGERRPAAPLASCADGIVPCTYVCAWLLRAVHVACCIVRWKHVACCTSCTLRCTLPIAASFVEFCGFCLVCLHALVCAIVRVCVQ